jgi:hypothetical protein
LQQIAKQTVEHFLNLPEQSNRKRGASTDESSTISKRQRAEEEDLAARFEKCSSCKEIFDIAKNSDQSCKTHPGMYSSK